MILTVIILYEFYIFPTWFGKKCDMPSDTEGKKMFHRCTSQDRETLQSRSSLCHRFFLGSFPNQSNKSVLLFFGEERLNNIHLYSPTWAHSRNILASAINNDLSMPHAACHRAITSCPRKNEAHTEKNVHKYTILAHWFLPGIYSGLQ